MIGYFDNNSATQPTEAVVDAMLPWLRTHYATALAPHHQGQEIHTHLRTTFQAFYRLFQASENDTITVVPSGAYAMNEILMGLFLSQSRDTGKDGFLTSTCDEAATLMGFERLETFDCETALIEVNQTGRIDLQHLEQSITPRTLAVVLTASNGLTGVVQPLAALRALCTKHDLLLVLDLSYHIAVQDIDWHQVQPDCCIVRSEIIHGPKGAALLYVRSGLTIPPLVTGIRPHIVSQSFDPAALIGLGVAVEELLSQRAAIAMQCALMKKKFLDGIQTTIPDSVLICADSDPLPTTCCIAFRGVASESLAFLLDRMGLCVTYGGGYMQQMHYQLQSMGFDATLRHSAISLTFSRFTTEDSVVFAIQRIKDAVQKLRKAGPKA